MDHSDVIKLDVGGKKFETTKSTITKYDNMLRRMFSDNFEPKLNSEGYVFIDRPGKNFDYILNYMRDGKVALPTDRNQVKEILMEARFFCFREMESFCENFLIGNWVDDDMPTIRCVYTKDEKLEMIKRSKVVVFLLLSLNEVLQSSQERRNNFMGQIREFENRRRAYPRMPLVLDLTKDQKRQAFEKQESMGDPRNSDMYLEAYVHGQLHAKLAYSQEAVIGQWPRDETLHFRKIETSLSDTVETLLYFLTDTIPTTIVSEAQENPNPRVRLPKERPGATGSTTRH